MTRRSLHWQVFAVSSALLAYEIGLMRVLLYASWHHFAFLVISIALLGFGASGTALCFLRDRLLRKPGTAMGWLTLGTAVSIPVSFELAQWIPVEARFVPVLLARQVGNWILYWMVLAVPFLVGATGIGLGLAVSRGGVATVYAANLFGSAVGAIAATAAMNRLSPEWLPAFAGGLAFLGMIANRRRARTTVSMSVFCLLVLGWGARPPQIRVDDFKYRSHVQRLVDSGDAVLLARAFSPRSVVEVFGGAAFHSVPFLAPGTPPPPMSVIVIDGHAAGTTLDVSTAFDARVVDRTLAAFAYDVAAPEPRVLLLDEKGGINVWLALRKNARAIHVAQPDHGLIDILRGPMNARGGHVFEFAPVRVSVADPRHAVDTSPSAYEVVQLAGLESWAVEGGGLAGLNQDYLVTEQGLAACLETLTPDGVLVMTRGIQLPPRDNVKLIATSIAALRRIGMEHPAENIVVARDFLAAIILVRRTPWSESAIERVRASCRQRELTPVYFPGIRPDELNAPDRLPGPAGQPGDWLYYATSELLSSRADVFLDTWPFDVRPPNDDRPFFANFSKLGTIGVLRGAYGELWLTRTELGLLFVLFTVLVTAAAGALLILIPVLLARGLRGPRGKAVTAAYFVCIGIAYMVIEIGMLSRLVRLVGDPVAAGAVTIAAFLLFSGLGSLASQRTNGGSPGIGRVVTAIAAVLLAEALLYPWVLSRFANATAAVRIAVAMVLVGGPAFFMGFPMPSALRRLGVTEPALVPLAWAANGFASVVAPPLATAIGMLAGLAIPATGAILCYIAAATLFRFLPGTGTSGGDALGSPHRAGHAP